MRRLSSTPSPRFIPFSIPLLLQLFPFLSEEEALCWEVALSVHLLHAVCRWNTDWHLLVSVSVDSEAKTLYWFIITCVYKALPGPTALALCMCVQKRLQESCRWYMCFDNTHCIILYLAWSISLLERKINFHCRVNVCYSSSIICFNVMFLFELETMTVNHKLEYVLHCEYITVFYEHAKISFTLSEQHWGID